MHWLGDWELCQKLDCRERKSIAFVSEPFHARQWLQRAKGDALRLSAMRNLLPGHNIDPRTLSDDDVIHRVADLVVSDRLHIHVRPMQRTLGPTLTRQASPAPVKAKPAAPPPRKAASMDDPPTFSNIDFAAQAATLVAAADSGAAFCPT